MDAKRTTEQCQLHDDTGRTSDVNRAAGKHAHRGGRGGTYVDVQYACGRDIKKIYRVCITVASLQVVHTVHQVLFIGRKWSSRQQVLRSGGWDTVFSFLRCADMDAQSVCGRDVTYT